MCIPCILGMAQTKNAKFAGQTKKSGAQKNARLDSKECSSWIN